MKHRLTKEHSNPARCKAIHFLCNTPRRWAILKRVYAFCHMQLKSHLDALTASQPPATVLIIGSSYAGVELALAVKERLGGSGDV